VIPDSPLTICASCAHYHAPKDYYETGLDGFVAWCDAAPVPNGVDPVSGETTSAYGSDAVSGPDGVTYLCCHVVNGGHCRRWEEREESVEADYQRMVSNYRPRRMGLIPTALGTVLSAGAYGVLVLTAHGVVHLIRLLLH